MLDTAAEGEILFLILLHFHTRETKEIAMPVFCFL